METTHRNGNKLYARMIAAGLVLGGVTTAVLVHRDSAPSKHSSDSSNTFTFPDGTKCIRGVYFGFIIEGLQQKLEPDGSCVRNFEPSKNAIGVNNANSIDSSSRDILSCEPAFGCTENHVPARLNINVSNR